VFLNGAPVALHSPLEAQRYGIAVMHQHPGLFPHLSVAENIFIGHLPKNRWANLDRAHMGEETRRLLDAVGLASEPDEPLSRLRSSEQQLVEIARALSVRARVLIMDEPTAALSRAKSIGSSESSESCASAALRGCSLATAWKRSTGWRIASPRLLGPTETNGRGAVR
jgi:ABC-type sugar transport system ATPase subunit